MPTGASIPEPRAAALAVFAVLAAALMLGGCAQVRSRLPTRHGATSRPATTVPAKPRTPATTPGESSELPNSSGFVVLSASAVERERTRVRQALAKSDADALAAKDVGYTLDVLQGRLRQVAGARASVVRHGSRLGLDLTRSVGFAPGGPQLGPGAPDLVEALGKLLAEYGPMLVTVHVSSVDATSNDSPQLAYARTLAFAQHLADAGLPRRRILVVGPGGRAPDGARVVVEVEPIVRAATRAK